jgi:hypothetical protein
MVKQGIRILVAVVVVAGTAVGITDTVGAATENPVVGQRLCRYVSPGSFDVTCSFSGTVGGAPFTGAIEDGVITYDEVRSCSPSPGVTYRDGIYSLFGGSGVFRNVHGYGRYTQRYQTGIGVPSNLDVQTFGGASGCGAPIALPTSFPPFIAQQDLPAANLGRPYSVGLSVSEGTAPYRWRVRPVTGKLPRGLKIDKRTGTIAGVPKKGTGVFVFWVDVRDGSRPKQIGYRQLSITVLPAT